MRNKAGAAAAPPGGPDSWFFGSFPPFLRRNRGRGPLGHGARNTARGARNTARQATGKADPGRPGRRIRADREGCTFNRDDVRQGTRASDQGIGPGHRTRASGARTNQARTRREVSRGADQGPRAGLTTNRGRCRPGKEKPRQDVLAGFGWKRRSKRRAIAAPRMSICYRQ